MEILTAAYGDGQIGPDEYDERVVGVEEADNARRLERWIDDLQVSPATRTRRKRLWWNDVRGNWKRASLGAKVVTCALVLAATGVVGGAIARLVMPADSSPAVVDRLNSGLADFREAYASEFDTTVGGNLQIDPDHVRFEVLVETEPPRSQAWSWQDGTFAEVGSVRSTASGVVDLDDIDVPAIDEALRGAIPGLGVPDVSHVTTIIRPTPGVEEAQVTLMVRNAFEETARLVLDLDGEEISRQSFDEAEVG